MAVDRECYIRLSTEDTCDLTVDRDQTTNLVQQLQQMQEKPSPIVHLRYCVGAAKRTFDYHLDDIPMAEVVDTIREIGTTTSQIKMKQGICMERLDPLIPIDAVQMSPTFQVQCGDNSVCVCSTNKNTACEYIYGCHPLPHSGTYLEMYNRPSSNSDSTSTISETHSYPNLSSECDSDDKPGTLSMPDHLKVGHYDGMVLYAESDRPKVIVFLKHLHSDIRLKNGDPIKCVPYDGEELSGLSGLKFEQLDMAFGRCSITFMFITKTFVNDIWCKISNESVLMRMIRDKHLQWRVVPVYTKRLDDCDFNIPMGLNALKGISYYQNDEFYRKGVVTLIEKTVPERREKERRLRRERSDWLKSQRRCHTDLAQELDEKSGKTDDISISMVQPQRSTKLKCPFKDVDRFSENAPNSTVLSVIFDLRQPRTCVQALRPYHERIYNIYSPKAVHIGDENVVQTVNPKTVNDNKLDNEIAVKNQSQVVPNNNEEKMGKESGSDEEDSLGNNHFPREVNTEQISGELRDHQHISVRTVVMDAALSSTRSSFSPGDSDNTLTGQEDSKHNQPMSREEPFLKDESKTTSTRAINGGRAKLALPVKPDLPTKPHKNKLQNDTDPTLVKPKVTLPVRNQDLPTDDASNSTASAISPRILNTGFQRPVAKIEPYARNEHENTDPKTVIQSEETALKSPARSTIVEGEVHAETEPVSLGGDLDETLVKNAHETSQQTLRENSIERPTQTIQSLMHLQALEKSGQMDKSHNDKNNNNNSDTCRKQESCGRPLFQAPPFSTFRRSDALTLFYKNRPDVKGEALNETVAINNLNFSDLSEADSVRQRSLTHQSMPLGEDPLSHLPESIGFIPNDASDLDEDDLEYDFLEDSFDEVASSLDSQPSQSSRSSKLKLSSLLANIKGCESED